MTIKIDTSYLSRSVEAQDKQHLLQFPVPTYLICLEASATSQLGDQAIREFRGLWVEKDMMLHPQTTLLHIERIEER